MVTELFGVNEHLDAFQLICIPGIELEKKRDCIYADDLT